MHGVCILTGNAIWRVLAVIVLHEVSLGLARVAHAAPIAREAASVCSVIAEVALPILIISVGGRTLRMVRHSLHPVAKQTVFEWGVVCIVLLRIHRLLRLLGLHEAPVA